MKNNIFILSLLAIVVVGVLIFLLISKGNNNYSFDDITNYQAVNLPLDSPEEAIQYSLSIPEVREILLNKGTFAYQKYGEAWSASASLVSPVGGTGIENVENDKSKEEGYIVNWNKGKKCDFYVLQIKFALDGTLLTNLTRYEERGLSVGTCK